MEVYIDVLIEDKNSCNRLKANEATYIFVGVNDNGHPTEIPEIIPETPLEMERFNAALRRRQLSLILAGRLAPKDATELKSIFE
jgi:acyl-CoA hydrolase